MVFFTRMGDIGSIENENFQKKNAHPIDANLASVL